MIAVPVLRGMATMVEMRDSLTLADCMDMMEIIAVDTYNARLWQDWSKHERR